jgi:hypothetical protein
LEDHARCRVEKRTAYRVLMEKPEGKRPLRKSKHGLQHNSKMDPGETAWGNMTVFNVLIPDID